jgi:phage baseplate assembly protein V
MNLNDFYRLTSTLRNKIFMMLARGIVKAVKNDEGTQKLQIVCLADETLGNVERLQEYGFETFPDTDAEVFAAFVNGNRETGVVLVTHDRRYRPKTLVKGEVMVYTKFSNHVHLKADGSIVCTESGGAVLMMKDGEFTLSGKVFLKATGGQPVMLETIIDKLNNHTHIETGGVTGTMTAGGTTLVAGTDSASDVKAAI